MRNGMLSRRMMAQSAHEWEYNSVGEVVGSGIGRNSEKEPVKRD